eukprot:1265287-Rhodomonas_salina.1
MQSRRMHCRQTMQRLTSGGWQLRTANARAEKAEQEASKAAEQLEHKLKVTLTFSLSLFLSIHIRVDMHSHPRSPCTPASTWTRRRADERGINVCWKVALIEQDGKAEGERRRLEADLVVLCNNYGSALKKEQKLDQAASMFQRALQVCCPLPDLVPFRNTRSFFTRCHPTAASKAGEGGSDGRLR